MLLLLEVHFFSCDLNLLYEDLISLVFILASFLQLRKTRNQRPAKFSTNEVVALYGMLYCPATYEFSVSCPCYNFLICHALVSC